MSEQLMLDLFNEGKRHRQTPKRRFLNWAHDIHGCGSEIDSIVGRLFDTMPDPFERGKALVMAYKHEKFDRQVLDDLGLFDASLDYHVCWDRAWALSHGVPSALISDIQRCDHNSKAPGFFDRLGERIQMVQQTLDEEG